MFFISSSYECNLRAYLMAVDFESVINSGRDIIELDRKVYFPIGAGFLPLFEGSPLEHNRMLAKQV